MNKKFKVSSKNIAIGAIDIDALIVDGVEYVFSKEDDISQYIGHTITLCSDGGTFKIVDGDVKKNDAKNEIVFGEHK